MQSWTEILASLGSCDLCDNQRMVIRQEDDSIVYCPQCTATVWGKYQWAKILEKVGLSNVPETSALKPTRILQAARMFLADPYQLTVVSSPGTGKTTTALAIARHFLRDPQQAWFRIKRCTADYFTWYDLLERMKQGYDDRNPDGQQFWERVMNTTLLIIDNVEYAQKTEWSRAKMFEFVDRRYLAARNENPLGRKFTIYLFNKHPQEYFGDNPALVERITKSPTTFVVVESAESFRERSI